MDMEIVNKLTNLLWVKNVQQAIKETILVDVLEIVQIQILNI